VENGGAFCNTLLLNYAEKQGNQHFDKMQVLTTEV